MRIRNLLVLLAAACILLPAAALAQQDYPNRPIRIIIPFGPGTSIDALGRVLGARLSTELGQPVVVDNRAGASGIIGAEAVAKSAPDGYTLLLGSSSVFALNPATFAKLPYDAAKSFAPITVVGAQPMVVAVSTKVPANSLQELVDLARSKPGVLTAGTLGSFHVLALQHFSTVTNTRVLNVPYKTGTVLALVSGEIDMMLDVIALVMPQSKAGKVRALAVTTDKRSSLAPDLPTVAELGYPGFNISAWTGLVAPVDTPRPIIDRLNRAMVKILNSPDFADQFLAQGIRMAPSTPEHLGDYIRSEISNWQKVARDAGITPQ